METNKQPFPTKGQNFRITRASGASDDFQVVDTIHPDKFTALWIAGLDADGSKFVFYKEDFFKLHNAKVLS